MGIQPILREFRAGAEKLYRNRLKGIILYGSWARDEATDDSDIDLVVVLAGDVTPGKEIDKMIDMITDINLKHGVLLAVYPVSEEDYTTANSPLLLRVRREGVSFVNGPLAQHNN